MLHRKGYFEELLPQKYPYPSPVCCRQAVITVVVFSSLDMLLSIEIFFESNYQMIYWY